MNVHDSNNPTWCTGCIYNGFTIEILHIKLNDSSIIAYNVNNSNFILMHHIVVSYIINKWKLCTVPIVAMMLFSIWHEIFTIKAEYFLDTYTVQVLF